MAGIGLQIDVELLRPLIAEVVAQTMKTLEQDATRLGGKLAFTEAEAAELLSLRQHQLRDERRRGRIQCSQGPGRMLLYSREDLLAYLANRRWTRS